MQGYGFYLYVVRELRSHVLQRATPTKKSEIKNALDGIYSVLVTAERKISKF